MTREKHEFGYSPDWAELMGFPKMVNPKHPVNNGTLHYYLNRTFRFSVADQLWKVTEETMGTKSRYHAEFCTDAPDHDGYCKSPDPEEVVAPLRPNAWLDEVRRTLRELERMELRMRNEEDHVLGRGMPFEYGNRTVSESEMNHILTRRLTGPAELQSVSDLRRRIWHAQHGIHRLLAEARKRGYTDRQIYSDAD